jgi:hypothetical protein
LGPRSARGGDAAADRRAGGLAALGRLLQLHWPPPASCDAPAAQQQPAARPAAARGGASWAQPAPCRPGARRYVCNKTQIGQFLTCSFMRTADECKFRKGCNIDDLTMPPTGSQVACVPDLWIKMPVYKRQSFMSLVGGAALLEGHGWRVAAAWCSHRVERSDGAMPLLGAREPQEQHPGPGAPRPWCTQALVPCPRALGPARAWARAHRCLGCHKRAPWPPAQVNNFRSDLYTDCPLAKLAYQYRQSCFEAEDAVGCKGSSICSWNAHYQRWAAQLRRGRWPSVVAGAACAPPTAECTRPRVRFGLGPAGGCGCAKLLGRHRPTAAAPALSLSLCAGASPAIWPCLC